MKTNVFAILWMIILVGCVQNKKEKAEALLTDPVMQEEIFNAILSDSARLNIFFEKVHKEGKGQGSRHQRMMKKMCYSSGMDSLFMCDGSMQGKMMRQMLKQTDQDSMFCRQMGDSVMKHDRLRMHLQQKMRQDNV